MKKIVRYILLCLLPAFCACQPQFEMVPPGYGSISQEFDENWYVTANGAGLKNGNDWTNAISFNRFLEMITASDASFTTAAFHIMEGTYKVPARKNTYRALSGDICCIRGGYSAASEYSDLSHCDPSLYPTVFTGDLDGDGKAGEGDGAFAYITGGHIRFDNITFKNFYLSSTLAGNLGGKGSAVFGINGPYYSTIVECRNCRFEGNVNGVAGNSGQEGGSCAMVTAGYLELSDCIFRGNSANSRGGAIRTNSSKGLVFMNRCLFTGNSIAGTYGMNNTTMVGNSGKGSTLNGGGAFLVVSSTIIDDADPDDESAAFRCESQADRNTTVINSVFSSSKANGYGVILNANGTLVSKGFNLFKNIEAHAGSSDPSSATKDTKKDVVLNGSLQGKCWKWDISQVRSDIKDYAIVDDVYDAAIGFDPSEYCDIFVVGKSFVSWLTPISLAKDARGSIRGDERFQPGAYDPNID